MSTPLTDAINALTTYANSVTGASDTTLSDAVDTLVDGYGGGGGGVLTGTFTPSARAYTVNINIGTTNTINALIIVPTSESPLKSGGKTLVAFIGMKDGFYKYYGLTTNNAGSSMLTPSISESTACFTQSGSQITVSPNGAGMFEPISYTWYAW